MEWTLQPLSLLRGVLSAGFFVVLLVLPAAAHQDFLDRCQHEDLPFQEMEIGNRIVVYFHPRTIGGARVEKDYILYQFDRQTGELIARKSHWRDDLPDTMPAPLIGMEEAVSRAEGEVQWAELSIVSPESDVLRLDPCPENPCWVVSSLGDGFVVLTVVDAVDGRVLGYGVPPPHDAYSLTGPWYFLPCDGGWYDWADNAAAWFDSMGYDTDQTWWPSTAEVQSYVQSPTVSMFYELAHGSSYAFINGCIGGQSAEGTYSTDIESWIADYPKMPFTFLGSCGGMCETGDSSFSYEFRKGSTELTVTVGYCGMHTAECGWCWTHSIDWQDALFRYMSLGHPVREAFEMANADFPDCPAGDCMRFAGDSSFVVVPPVRRGGEKYRVDPSGTGDYPTIQAAVDVASDGDWIELADGVYTGVGNRDIEVAEKGLVFRSESGDPDLCVIDCEGLGRALHFHSTSERVSALSGISIVNGYAAGRSSGDGGAVCSRAVSVVLNQCSVTRNTAEGDGGGVCCDSAYVVVRMCTFADNGAGGSGGAIRVSGSSYISVFGSTVAGNTASVQGGGIAAAGSTRVLISGCTIAGNHAAGSQGSGGGLFCPLLERLEDCVLTGNRSGGVGGGIYLSPEGSLEPWITRCTIASNCADATGGGIHCEGDAPVRLDLTVVWGNCAGGAGREIYTGVPSAHLQLTCCDVDSTGTGGPGTVERLWYNVCGDPGFCGPEDCLAAPTTAGDYHLKDPSICAREHSPPVCHTIGALGVGCGPDTVTVCADGSGEYATIQEAVDGVTAYDVIELCDGIYSGVGNRDVDFGGKPIRVGSKSGDPEACVIDCGGQGRGFYCHSGEAAQVVIENLAIANGYADRGGAIYCGGSCPTVSRCLIHHCSADESGGAIYCFASSPSIESCTLVENTASVGAGLQCSSSSSPSVDRTIMVFGSLGEAVGCDGTSSATLTCSDLYGNEGGDWVGCVADQAGAGGNLAVDPLFCDVDSSDYSLESTSPCRNATGCGLLGALDMGCCRGWVWRVPEDALTIQAAVDSAVAGDTVLVSCGTYRERDIALKAGVVVRSETGCADCATIDAQGQGRVMVFLGEDSTASAVFVEGLTLKGGVAAGMLWPDNAGGGIYCEDASPRIRDCVLADNAAEWGGGITCRSSSAWIVNSTFARNSASGGGGGIYSYYASLTLENSVVAMSAEGQAIDGYGGGASLTCCDLYDNAGGDWVGWVAGQDTAGGNFSVDPWFCNSDSGVFSVAELSPCAPEHSPNGCGLVGALGVGCVTTDVAQATLMPPAALSLGPAVPNPFNANTEISYGIPPGADRSRVVLKVYDALGRRVCTLVDAPHGPGVYRVAWDGRDHGGMDVASGVYFYRITWDGKNETKRMVLLK